MLKQVLYTKCFDVFLLICHESYYKLILKMYLNKKKWIIKKWTNYIFTFILIMYEILIVSFSISYYYLIVSFINNQSG